MLWATRKRAGNVSLMRPILSGWLRFHHHLRFCFSLNCSCICSCSFHILILAGLIIPSCLTRASVTYLFAGHLFFTVSLRDQPSDPSTPSTPPPVPILFVSSLLVRCLPASGDQPTTPHSDSDSSASMDELRHSRRCRATVAYLHSTCATVGSVPQGLLHSIYSNVDSTPPHIV
jgi:hypothetical protein